MSVRTRTHHTRSSHLRSDGEPTGDKTPWREVAKKEIRRFSGAGVMLRGCRYKKDITQIELSKATGIQRNHISEIENGNLNR